METKILFHVNFNNYSNNSPCSRYFLDNYCRHLIGKYQTNDGGGDCQYKYKYKYKYKYNNGNDQGNEKRKQ